MALEIINDAYRDLERQKLVNRALRDPFWLGTEIMGYTLLTEAFHRPIMLRHAAMDRRTASGTSLQDDLLLAARDHYKTTMAKVRVVCGFLRSPLNSNVWWHAVEEHAQLSGADIAWQLQYNKSLRKLFPQGVLPHQNRKRFYVGGEFRLGGRVTGDPSFKAWGAGSEATGGHALEGYLDDIIGLNDIMDNLMPKKRRWMGATVRNVVRTGRPLHGTGTRWDENDIYEDWIKSPYWTVECRAALETDGLPDPKGAPVLYDMAWIEKKRCEMTEFEFGCQMMNTPMSESQRMWTSECEHFCSIREAAHPGVIFILSDPAPALIGSPDSRAESARQDGSKNEWAICAYKHQLNGKRLEHVLLDGQASKEWTKDEGFEAEATMAKRWGTPFIVRETTGMATAFYETDAQHAARRMGVSVSPIRLSWTYQGKKVYHEALRSKAKRGEFLICESVPKDFLDPALEQLRTQRFNDKGRSLIRFDDRANVISFGCDPALQGYAPAVGIQNDPWGEQEDQGYVSRSRYCGV